jgi:SAM-dependent methyltransferase
VNAKEGPGEERDLDLVDRIEMAVSDICDMPEYPEDHFAMVLCEGDPLGYCGDHARAMAELVRVVRLGGRVVASVDNRPAVLRWLGEAPDLEAVERLLETGDVVNPAERENFRYVVHTFTSEELQELFQSSGLDVERIIGKLVLAHRLSGLESDDPEIQEWLYELELKHNADPAYLPWAGHLEIVGRKT